MQEESEKSEIGQEASMSDFMIATVWVENNTTKMTAEIADGPGELKDGSSNKKTYEDMEAVLDEDDLPKHAVRAVDISVAGAQSDTDLC